MSRLPKNRVEAYGVFRRAAEWLPDFVRAPCQAVWLGVFDSDGLNAVTQSSYEGATGFESAEFNVRQGLWPWEEAVIRANFDGARRVLVAGCGGGREVVALARLGFEVTAFDSTPELVVACRANVRTAGVEATIFEAPPGGIPAGLDRYDAVLVGRGVYHHIPGRDARITLLAGCRRYMKPSAPLILSDFHERAERSRRHEWIRDVAGLVRRWRESSDRVEVGDWLTWGFQHAFVREEIEAEVVAAGLALVSYAKVPFGDGARLAHVIARAPD